MKMKQLTLVLFPVPLGPVKEPQLSHLYTSRHHFIKREKCIKKDP